MTRFLLFNVLMLALTASAHAGFTIADDVRRRIHLVRTGTWIVYFSRRNPI